MRRGDERIRANVVARPDDRDAAFVFAAVSAMLFSVALAVPAFAILPVVASAALSCAALLALAARLPASRAGGLLLGDLAGACMLVAVAAAIFSQPAQIVQTFAFLAR